MSDPKVDSEDKVQFEEQVKETGEIVYKIKGQMVKYSDGTMEKTKMFDMLQVPLDDYSDLEFTLSEARRMRMHLMKMKTGIQAMAPLNCSGPVRCPFSFRCPIVDKSKRTPDGAIDLVGQNIKAFPLMRSCLVEREFIDSKRVEYMNEYEVDNNSPTEMAMANKLAVLDLYEYRLTLVMANGDEKGEGMDLMKLQPSGATKDGTILERLEEHPAWEVMEKIHRQREDILRGMVGTRREKYKKQAALNEAKKSDLSTTTAELREKLEKLEREANEENIQDAEFTEIKEEK